MRIVEKQLLLSLALLIGTLPVAAEQRKSPPQHQGCKGLGEPSFFKDEAVAFKVNSKFQFNKTLMREKIDVKNNGGIVTLSGNVSTPEQIALAGKLASEVNGVQCVNNFLNVGPPIKEPEKER